MSGKLFYWIYDYPTAKVGTLFAVVFVLVTWAGTFILRRFMHPWFHRDRRANEMVGFVLSSYSVFYGILIGLIAVAAYQNFGTVGDLVTREASSLSALYRDLAGYPQPIRGRLQGDLREYTRSEIERDWPQQQRGIVPSEGTHRLRQFTDALMAFEPAALRDETVHAEALRQVNNYMDLRRSRLNSVTVGIPAVLWWVVAIGAVIALLLVAMLDMEIHSASDSRRSPVDVSWPGHLSHCCDGQSVPWPGQRDARSIPAGLRNSQAAQRCRQPLHGGADRPDGDTGCAARLEGRDRVAGRDVPALYFGSSKMNNSFDVVDEVAREEGGAASLFVRSGDEFVRVATNAKTGQSSRALGVLLDPKGPAIENRSPCATLRVPVPARYAPPKATVYSTTLPTAKTWTSPIIDLMREVRDQSGG